MSIMFKISTCSVNLLSDELFPYKSGLLSVLRHYSIDFQLNRTASGVPVGHEAFLRFPLTGVLVKAMETVT